MEGCGQWVGAQSHEDFCVGVILGCRNRDIQGSDDDDDDDDDGGTWRVPGVLLSSVGL